LFVWILFKINWKLGVFVIVYCFTHDLNKKERINGNKKDSLFCYQNPRKKAGKNIVLNFPFVQFSIWGFICFVRWKMHLFFVELWIHFYRLFLWFCAIFFSLWMNELFAFVRTVKLFLRD
jgi:hypothetical protein